MFFIDNNSPFPAHSKADEDGLLAIGGTLTPQRLMQAYTMGIFPWYNHGQPVLWWSPDPRMVLYVNDFKVSKSLRQTLKKNQFTVTFNKAFQAVMENCANTPRKKQDGTWISPGMIEAYMKLHQGRDAVSVEVWHKDELVGGLYGIDLKKKKVFCGESMFHLKTDASKIAFYYLVERLKADEYILIDCQVYTAHLESLGAMEIPRDEFLRYLL